MPCKTDISFGRYIIEYLKIVDKVVAGPHSLKANSKMSAAMRPPVMKAILAIVSASPYKGRGTRS